MAGRGVLPLPKTERNYFPRENKVLLLISCPESGCRRWHSPEPPAELCPAEGRLSWGFRRKGVGVGVCWAPGGLFFLAPVGVTAGRA